MSLFSGYFTKSISEDLDAPSTRSISSIVGLTAASSRNLTTAAGGRYASELTRTGSSEWDSETVSGNGHTGTSVSEPTTLGSGSPGTSYGVDSFESAVPSPAAAGKREPALPLVSAPSAIAQDGGSDDGYEDDVFEDPIDTYGDDEFEAVSAAGEPEVSSASWSGRSRGETNDRYSDESFEPDPGSSTPPRPPPVRFPALPGPLLPAPRVWPPREPRPNSPPGDSMFGYRLMLNRLAAKQEEAGAAQELEDRRAERLEAAMEPALDALCSRARAGDAQQPRSCMGTWNDVLLSRPAPGALADKVTQLALRGLAASPGSFIEGQSSLVKDLACLQRPQLPADAAASIFFRRATDRVTSQRVEDKLLHEWDSVAIEEMTHPVALAGRASREYLEAQAQRMPQVSEDSPQQQHGGRFELLRAAERSRLLRSAAAAILGGSQEPGSPGAAVLATTPRQHVDESPFFVPGSSAVLLAAAAAGRGEDGSRLHGAGGEQGDEEEEDAAVVWEEATPGAFMCGVMLKESRELREVANRVLIGGGRFTDPDPQGHAAHEHPSVPQEGARDSSSGASALSPAAAGILESSRRLREQADAVLGRGVAAMERLQ